MAKVYKNQSELRLLITVGVAIAGATCLIKYKKPSGATGSWSASVYDVNGIISYDIPDINTLDESGKWRCWAYVTFVDGRVAPGEPFILEVFREGLD